MIYEINLRERERNFVTDIRNYIHADRNVKHDLWFITNKYYNFASNEIAYKI